jgi:hypothetical protein
MIGRRRESREKGLRPRVVAPSIGAGPRRAAAIGIEPAVDVFLERAERGLGLVRQTMGLVQPRQALLKLSKDVAHCVMRGIVFFHIEAQSIMRADSQRSDRRKRLNDGN